MMRLISHVASSDSRRDLGDGFGLMWPTTVVLRVPMTSLHFAERHPEVKSRPVGDLTS